MRHKAKLHGCTLLHCMHLPNPHRCCSTLCRQAEPNGRQHRSSSLKHNCQIDEGRHSESRLSCTHRLQLLQILELGLELVQVRVRVAAQHSAVEWVAENLRGTVLLSDDAHHDGM